MLLVSNPVLRTYRVVTAGYGDVTGLWDEQARDLSLKKTEIDKVKELLNRTEDKLEFLYAAVLYIEVEKFLSRRTIVSMNILQKQFNIGFARAAFLLNMPLRDRLIRKGKDFEKSRAGRDRDYPGHERWQLPYLCGQRDWRAALHPPRVPQEGEGACGPGPQ
ncbi:MAG: hypothetical protein LC672_05495 [Acidobacteria bacterium]|nr:hypothetical protein [Acidobacteriota bacterium]